MWGESILKQSQQVGIVDTQRIQAHARLRINNRIYDLADNQTIVGRVADTKDYTPDIDLKGIKTVSRQHLSIEWDGERHYLRCLKDIPNKVYLNNQELGLDERVSLMDGDVVVFGDVLARFECLMPNLQLPQPERPYARLRWLGMGHTFYIQKNPGFIGRGRKKYFPKELLAFNFEAESKDILSLSRPHAKLWQEVSGRVFIKNLKPDALVWVNGERVTDTVELNNDASLKLARLLFHIQLMA